MLNAEVTERGKEQASAVDGHYNLVVCSTLTRAKQTLQYSRITYNKLIYLEEASTNAIEAHFFQQESSLTHRFSVWTHRFSVHFHKNLVRLTDSCGNELKSCAAKLEICESNLIPKKKVALCDFPRQGNREPQWVTSNQGRILFTSLILR